MARRSGSSWRNVPGRDKAILWGRAAARCCHPDCKLLLIEPATSLDDEAMFGQAAHIVAHSAEGPRAHAGYPSDKLDSYENLILLCGNHHAIVDKQANTYTSDDLRGWKSEHEAWVQSATTPQQYVPIPWTTVIQEDEPRIDQRSVQQALAPDVIAGEPHLLRISPEVHGWQAAADAQAQALTKVISGLPPDSRRLAVFSLTRIPLAIHLGFAITDRYRVSLHQFNRDRASWEWPQQQAPSELAVRELIATGDASGPVIIRVSLSATILPEITRGIVRAAIAEIDISVPNPSVMWLRAPNQVGELAIQYRDVLNGIRERFGARCVGIHLFYAGPTPGAIAIGRQHNPRMNSGLHLYEYDQRTIPSYQHVLLLR